MLVRCHYLHVRQNLRGDFRLLDAAEGPKFSAAAGTCFDLHPERSLQPPRPFQRNLVWALWLLRLARPNFWLPRPLTLVHGRLSRAQLAVWREHAENDGGMQCMPSRLQAIERYRIQVFMST